MQVITFPDAPEWAQEVRLDGSVYRLRVRWNPVSATWSFDVLTASRELIVAGLRLVRGQALLRQFVDDRLPPGDFVVYDTAARDDEYTDFTEGRAKLAYVTAAEVAEWA